MTMQELRLDIMKQGFIIQEKVINGVVRNSEDIMVDSQQVEIHLYKIDTDGLSLEAIATAVPELYQKVNAPQFTELLRTLTTTINKWQTDRHSRNPDECKHEYKIVRNKKVCQFCMGTFGEIVEFQGASYN